MNEKLKSLLVQLEKLQEGHTVIGKEMVPLDGHLYMMDIFAFATLNRSAQLLFGFCTLVENRNFISAAPLVRLQLDTYLRFAASSFVSDPHSFVSEVMRGTSIRDLKSKEKQKMTDRYLVKRLSTNHPWIESVYDQTCGYIHLSDKHIFNAMKLDGEDGQFTMVIHQQSLHVPDESFIEAAAAFEAITRLILSATASWSLKKNNPELLKKAIESFGLADGLADQKAGEK